MSCLKAVDLDPTYVKGLGRLAAAYNVCLQYSCCLVLNVDAFTGP